MKKMNKGIAGFLTMTIGLLFLLVETSFASIGIKTSIERLPGETFQVNGIEVENWVAYIMENLFKDNEFMQYAFDEGDYVLAGKVVHIPQAGAKPTIVKNRSGAGTIVQRTDTDITYALDAYTSDPVLIQNVEQVQVSYDKIASVLYEMMASLKETVADNVIYNWLVNGVASGAIVRTSGSSSASYLAPVATGTRKLFVKENLLSAQYIMNKQNVPKADRYALLPSEFVNQLNSDADLIKRDAQFGGELELSNGKVSKLYGFTIIDRSDVATFDNSGTPAVKAPGATGATDDNLAGMCYHKLSVARAMGQVDFFFREKDPVNYGDIYSTLLRMGGRIRRSDKAGVVAIVQTA